MCSKMDDTMEEEEMFARPNTVCTGCPVLEKKIVFYQKKISWLRRSMQILLHLTQKPLPYTLYSFNVLLLGPKQWRLVEFFTGGAKL